MAVIKAPPFFTTVVNAGEKRLLDYLEVHLPENYYLIPNVEIASTNPKNNKTQYWEYDLIVVAPHGIYNIENKDWKGRIEGDDNYWYLNDKQRSNPLKTGRVKTAVLASKLKETQYNWRRAWVQELVTLSYPNTFAPIITAEAQRLTFRLDVALTAYITDPSRIGKSENQIADIQQDLVEFLIGSQSKKKADEKREVQGYEIEEILQQETNFTEYLVKMKDVSSSLRKRVKEYTLQVAGLSLVEQQKREQQIQNQYKALHKLRAHPFILNVDFRIDNENHLFYEISEYLDDNSLKAEIRKKTFTFEQKIGVLRNVMAALKAAHQENIYHRDIHPENIFVNAGYAYLGNFGKSYFVDDSRKGYTVMPTINERNASPYHPIELTVGDSSRASDIYSLGVLIYWLFTGSEPIESPYELDRLGGKLPTERLPSAINPVLPKWLDELCHKTILVDDLQRMDSIDELETFINNALKEAESTVTPKEETTKTFSTPVDEYDLKEGDRVGDYTIYKVLGRGGYSKVFKVKHSLQGEEFALKLFHGSVTISSVLDEYKALIQLTHPNIVKFRWNGTTPSGQFYTLTEFLDGENLSMYARTDARLPIKRVYQVAKDILSALVMMQSQERPILHRDIKPQNIIWDNKRRFVLIDFNVASFAEENKDFVGTNPYLAPDLIRENYKVEWDTSADTFALGVTLFELICKQYPWSPKKMPLISTSPNKPKDIEPKLSVAFSEFLYKSIQTEVGKRFVSAKAMLAALEEIGEHHILETKSESPVPVIESGEESDFVAYINSLYSQSKFGNSGTRANFNTSQFDRITYTQTKLDRSLIPAVLDGAFKLLIITGNAGDGKTAFIRKIEEDTHVTDLERFPHKNGARFKINGVTFESNYDGSQDEDERANNEVLESFFKPFENQANYELAEEGRIIAINEGRLVEFLNTSTKYKQLANTIEEYFYQEGHHQLPDGLMIINLNLRSVVAATDTPSIFRAQIKALTDKTLWKKCEGCTVANKCFIKYNVDSFNDSAAGESVISRMEWLLKTVSLKRELHITMRDLRSLIAFMLTRDSVCSDIPDLVAKSHNSPESYWQYYYFNITDPEVSDSGYQDRLIRLLRETDIGEVAIPNLDRDLFFGQHLPNDYLEFAEREISLLDTFNHHKVSEPAHEQTDELIKRIKTIHKLFIRHQYYEGKGELIIVDEQPNHDLKMPSYLMRLPYHSVFNFVKKLKQHEVVDEQTKKSISRAISLNEGCDNTGIDERYLVLSSTEVKDPFSKSFRLFELDNFEIFVNHTEHLVDYLEYEPDSMTFRHKEEQHMKLTISLDLYEMLYFIQQGFSPSLNDLKGKFIELVIFKNLLENLTYNEVVVTQDNIEFFRIYKSNDSQLQIQSM